MYDRREFVCAGMAEKGVSNARRREWAVARQYTTLKHRKAVNDKVLWEGEDKKPAGGGLSFLLNCEAFPRVRKIVLASSASKLYLDGSLAVSGGERRARTNQDDRLRLGSGVSNLRG